MSVSLLTESCTAVPMAPAPAGAAAVPQSVPQPAAVPLHVMHALRRHFSPLRAAYIAKVLPVEEIQVISDLGDALILARIKRMPHHRLQRFDRLVPRDAEQARAYRVAQMEWIHSEFYLLSTRLGRAPTHAELSADFMSHRNGLRFRVFYAMKFPERMRDPSI